MTCTIPPEGWRCTRAPGHDGPCAALPDYMSPSATLWREVDALGGAVESERDAGYADALVKVLAILERRGFTEHDDRPTSVGAKPSLLDRIERMRREALADGGESGPPIIPYDWLLEVSDALKDLEAGKDELRQLMDSIWRAEYLKDAPEWKPLNDLVGMVSQIDNMYAGIREQRDRARWDLHHPAAAPAMPVGGDRAQESFLAQLRRVNTDRYYAWVGDGQDAGILFDAAELGGEVGELLNVVKKLVREEAGWRGSRAAPEDFADECADVLICLDKLARRRGVDLEAATVTKFNATSEKQGFPHALRPTSATEGEA